MVIVWEKAEGYMLGEEKNGQRSEKGEGGEESRGKKESGCTQSGQRTNC